MKTLYYLPERKYNEQSFNEYYAGIEQFIYTNKSVKYHIVLPLENFDCVLDLPVIQISGNVKIVSARSTFYPDIIEADKNRWMNELCLEAGDYCSPEFFLEIDRKMKRKTVLSECKEDIVDNVRNKWREILKALRLFKAGDLEFGYAYWYSKLPCNPQYIDDTMLAFRGNYDTPNKYVIEDDDIINLQVLFKKFSSNSGKDDFPQSSIDYLNDGAIENKPEKKLLDYIYGLETLLVHEKTNKKDLLTKRVSNFIGKNQDEWIQIIKNVEFAYNLRNKISHGRKDEVDLSVCKEYSKKMENYARQSINKWLDMVDKGLTRQDISDSIERVPFS
jgi:hypothetical protein